MEGKRQSWCGLVVGESDIRACLLCSNEDPQLRVFPNQVSGQESLVAWLRSAGCTNIALNPVHSSWKQVHGLLTKHFRVRVIQEQQVSGAPAAGQKETCCQWLAQLLKSGQLNRQDQVEPIGDRTPFSDEDAMGGEPGKSPEHSGQEVAEPHGD